MRSHMQIRAFKSLVCTNKISVTTFNKPKTETKMKINTILEHNFQQELKTSMWSVIKLTVHE